MKEHEKIILASIGGIGIYLFFKDKAFRKAVLKAWHDSVKDAEKS